MDSKKLTFSYTQHDEEFWLHEENFELLQEALDQLEKQVMLSLNDKEFLLLNHEVVINAWKFYSKVVNDYSGEVYSRDYRCYLIEKGKLRLRQAASLFREHCDLEEIYPESVYPCVNADNWEYLEWLKNNDLTDDDIQLGEHQWYV